MQVSFKSRQSYTGGACEGKNPKFLAVNHDTVSRDLGGRRAIPHRFTILRCLRPGFASAPYKAKNPKRDPDSKPLSVMSAGESGLVMHMYSYPKVGMYDKGPRSELTWTLSPGNTIKLWLDEERAKDEKLLPPGKDLEPFSLCEISVQSKTEESVKSGWCIKITSVRLVDFSFHSIVRDLESLSSSLGDARTRELLAQQAQPLLEKELETQSVAWWAPVRKEASLDDSDGTIRLVNWGEPMALELQPETLMRATNCSRVDWACALLEVGLAAGAVSVLVISNDFWKGGPRAFPVIDAEVFMTAPREPDGRTHFLVDGAALQIELADEPSKVDGERPPACDDFALAGPDAQLEAGHALQFNLVKPDGSSVPAVWKGYYNAGPSRLDPMPVKRKRMQTMDV